MNDKQTIKYLVDGLARIASNLGRGGVDGSASDKGSRPLRTEATECLRAAGLTYREYPCVEEDGWYRDGSLVGTWATPRSHQPTS